MAKGRVAAKRATPTSGGRAGVRGRRASGEVALVRSCHQSQACQVGGDDRHPPSRACCQGDGFQPFSLTPWATTTSSPMTTAVIGGLVLVWRSFSNVPAAELTSLEAAVSTTALVLHWHLLRKFLHPPPAAEYRHVSGQRSPPGPPRMDKRWFHRRLSGWL